MKYINYHIILQIIIGFALADILTGAGHWFEDTYLDYCIDTPIIGSISKDNELHHYFPRSIIAYSYLDNISIALPVTILLLFILYFINKKVFDYKYCLITHLGISDTWLDRMNFLVCLHMLKD